VDNFGRRGPQAALQAGRALPRPVRRARPSTSFFELLADVKTSKSSMSSASPVGFWQSASRRFHSKCQHSGRGNFFVVEILIEEGEKVEYDIFFEASRSAKKGLRGFKTKRPAFRAGLSWPLPAPRPRKV